MDPSNWDTDRVVDWLNENGLSLYFDQFENNKIDGATLLSEDFTESEQKELIPCIRDRVIFKKALRELRNSMVQNEIKLYECSYFESVMRFKPINLLSDPPTTYVTKVDLSNVSIVGDSFTEYRVRSNDVLEIITHNSEGGCAIPFEQLKLPVNRSLSNQVLEFDMEFLTVPNDEVGRHGGIYYGDHEFDRSMNNNVVIDWIDRYFDRGYRFYQTDAHSTIPHSVVPYKNEPARHLKIIIKANGEQILVIEDGVWRRLNCGRIHLLGKPCLGFWAWANNHLRISNFTIRPYIGTN
ncbi:hypothetical protein I4U23_022934 [Adineta vaga]|nr:hypothetical protein I4U23_022934 [Adineta vaga]